jgi:hypothetical protein
MSTSERLFDEAERLHQEGYPSVAGCLLRAAMEFHVRSLCRLHDCTPNLAPGFEGTLPTTSRCGQWLLRRGWINRPAKTSIDKVLHYTSKAQYGLTGAPEKFCAILAKARRPERRCSSMTTIIIHDHVLNTEEVIQSPRALAEIAARLSRQVQKLDASKWTILKLCVQIDASRNRVSVHWLPASGRDEEFVRETVSAGGLPARTSLWLSRGRRAAV